MMVGGGSMELVCSVGSKRWDMLHLYCCWSCLRLLHEVTICNAERTPEAVFTRSSYSYFWKVFVSFAVASF